MERPSVPLVASGDEGPPKIVEIQEKYSAVEGKCRHQVIMGRAQTFIAFQVLHSSTFFFGMATRPNIL